MKIVKKALKKVFNLLGYKIVIIKAVNGSVDIDGDKELLRYVDTSGYLFKKDPLKRFTEKFQDPYKREKLKPVTIKELNEMGITFDPLELQNK